MNITALAKRSVYPQTGTFSYAADLALNTTAGSVQFGFSGQNGRQVFFNLVSGALFDYEDNLVHGLAGGQTLSISGNVSNYQHDYWLNDVPTRISGAKATGAAEWFYVDPTGCQVTLNLNLAGIRPQVEFSNIFYSGLTGVGTGFVTNLSPQRLRIFSGVSQDSDYRVEFPSGYIYGTVPFSGYKNNINFANSTESVNIDYTLYTNFGTITQTITNFSQFFLSQILIPQVNSAIADTGTSQSFVSWENTVGAVSYDQPLAVDFYLRWSSGAASGNFTGAWSLQTGLQDGTLLLDVPYYSGITGFSGQFDTVAAGSRYFKIDHLATGQNILEFWATGYGGAGFLTTITGGL